MNHVQVGTRLFNLGQLFGLLKVADGLSFEAVSVPALLEPGVIEFTAKREYRVQAGRLRLTRIQAIFESFSCSALFNHLIRVRETRLEGESEVIVAAMASLACIITHLKAQI